MPKNKKEASSSSSSDSGPDDKAPPKKAAKTATPPAKPAKADSSEESEQQWILERMRFVKINEFRGRKTVDIREHYEKDGKILPGKKGIALTPIQWRKLLEHAAEITKAIED